jgi:hypothetical protein
MRARAYDMLDVPPLQLRGDMRKKRPRAVFVPYELKNGVMVRTKELPRFVESEDVIEFLGNRPDLHNRRLDWREEFDSASITEYMMGVGEDQPEPAGVITLH